MTTGDDDEPRLERAPAVGGFLLALGPAVHVLLAGLHIDLTSRGLPWHEGGAWHAVWRLGIPALISLGGWRVLARRPLGRPAATLGLLTAAGILALAGHADPALVLAVLLILSLLLTWVWGGEAGPRRERLTAESLREAAIAAAWGGLLTFVAALGTGLADAIESVLALALADALVLGLVGAATRPRRGGTPVRRSWLALAVTAILAAAASEAMARPVPLPLLALVPLAALLALRAPRTLDEQRDRATSWLEPLVSNPARMMVGSFLVTGLVGGVLLSLDASAARAGGVGLLDAMFTAFSATCVTGLVVVDTPNDLSFIGQVVVLLLIQVGGLGIMSFAASFMTLLGRRMSLRHEEAVADLIGGTGRGTLVRALRTVLVVTFVTEAVGAGVLTWLFSSLPGETLDSAAWRGIFTAISAFCNAGFALQTDSLLPYAHQVAIVHVVGLLVILGGLGPLVIAAVVTLPLRRRRLSLHARMVLTTTAVLLLVPAIFLTFVEWEGAFRHFSIWETLTHAWFQSLTTRTAGFNSVDLNQLHPASVTLMDVLMFVGGSPGSTAGGIKTTTALLLMLTVTANLRGAGAVTIAGWRIPRSTAIKAFAVATMTLATIVGAVMLLQLTQTMPFRSAVFEVVSAVGTVGLSLGATSELDGVGKVVIIVCMFVGRVGPLSLLLVGAQRADGDDRRLPEQEILVG